MITTDICIVGAGPGGACTALALAEQKIPCVLVDKAVFPRDKVGGDVLPGIILRALHEIRPEYVTKFSEQANLLEIKGTQIFAPNGRSLNVDYRKIKIGNFENTTSCFAASRQHFDNLLIQEVRASNYIDFIEGQAIHNCNEASDGLILSSKSNDFTVKAKLVIAASGASAPLSKKLSGYQSNPKHRGVGIRAYMQNVDWSNCNQYAQLYFLKDLLPGIFYITPLANGRTNVNLGTREDVLKSRQIDLKAILEHTISTHPIIGPMFENAHLEAPPKGWVLPFATQKRKLYGDRYLLVGDSGSLIDFVSGNGIGSAMYSGLFAAKKAAMALHEQNFSAGFLQDYEEQVYQKLKANLKLGRMLAPFFGFTRCHGLYRRVINGFIGRAGKSDLVAELLYSKNIEKELRSWAFYRKLLKGKRSA